LIMCIPYVRYKYFSRCIYDMQGPALNCVERGSRPEQNTMHLFQCNCLYPRACHLQTAEAIRFLGLQPSALLCFIPKSPVTARSLQISRPSNPMPSIMLSAIPVLSGQFTPLAS